MKQVKVDTMDAKLSFPLKLFELLIRMQGKGFSEKGFPQLRKKIDQGSYSVTAPMPRSFKKLFLTQESQLDGNPVFTVAPLHGKPSIQVIYTHGGAYFGALQWIHWSIIRQFVERIGAQVTIPIYPRAPKRTYRDAFPMLEKVYRKVLNEAPNDKIVFCGDSAGGGFALAQAMHFRELGLRLPDRLVLFSPWVDITMSNPDIALFETQDIMLSPYGLLECGKWWAGGDDPRSPLLSPIYGNPAGLPPIDLFMGASEIFVPDVRKLKEKIIATGGVVNLYEYPKAFHVFVGATISPESKNVFNHIVANLGVHNQTDV